MNTWGRFTSNYGMPADNCGINPARFEAYEDRVESLCGVVITRTWIVFDFCGRSDTCVQVITIGDNTPPTMIGAIRDIEVECMEDVPAPMTLARFYALGGKIIDDNGIIESTWTVTDEETPGTCPKIITRTYSVEDICGNISTIRQFITINDNKPPVLTCPPGGFTNV
jgi:hypothetical protein